MHLTGTTNGQAEFSRKGVYNRNTDTVKTARDLVSVVIELSTGVEDCHDHFSGRDTLLFVNVCRNTTTVIAYGNTLVSVNRDTHLGTVTCKRFIDAVINQLKHHVMQT